MVDLAVVDPATRSLVLRAGGTHGSHAHSTLVQEQKESRLDAVNSFDAASDQMIENFDSALKRFEASVQAGRANVRVVERSGSHGGGGAACALDMIFLGLLAARRLRRQRRGFGGVDAG